jgi:alpha-D-xyloside xylohydrolase
MDQKVRDCGDQFMFGPALLVAPVTEPGATKREVYLPEASGWFDFWTGTLIPAGNRLDAPAPLERIPVYVRTGSIVPLGPLVENADVQPDMLEVRVYPGADADFEWYSDAGDTYEYEKGAYRIVVIHWDDTARTLTLAESRNSFPGMPKRVQIRLVVVREAHGIGGALTEASDGEGVYNGKTLRVKAR